MILLSSENDGALNHVGVQNLVQVCFREASGRREVVERVRLFELLSTFMKNQISKECDECNGSIHCQSRMVELMPQDGKQKFWNCSSAVRKICDVAQGSEVLRFTTGLEALDEP